MRKKTETIRHAIKIDIDTRQKTLCEITRLIVDKIYTIQEIIKNTIVSMNQYKKYEIFSNSDVVICITTLVELYNKTKIMTTNIHAYHIPMSIETGDTPGHPALHISETSSTSTASLDEINAIIDELQQIIDKISIVICGFGTLHMRDLFFISFGSEFNAKHIENEIWRAKLELLLEHVSPIGYKTVHWKQGKPKPKELCNSSGVFCLNKTTEDTIQLDGSIQYECFDVDPSTKSLYVKLYGVRVVIHNEKMQKTLIVQGVADDVVLDCIRNTYVDHRKKELLDNIPESETYDKDIMNRIVETLTMKDILIYGNADIYKRHIGIMSVVNSIKYNKLNITLKKFVEMDIYTQRNMLISLLIYNKEDDIQYITYLLYDLITDSSGSASDSIDQMLIYESFPWKIKLFFKDTMKNTMKYTKDMVHKYDVNRVSLEQQIYVMKVPENVKEKAMLKLKDIKGKSDDSSSKSKQYLEGLLKIPFGVYCEEPILKKVKTIQAGFMNTLSRTPGQFRSQTVLKERYTSLEMTNHIRYIKQYIAHSLPGELEAKIRELSSKPLNSILTYIARFLPRKPASHVKTREDKIESIATFLKENPTEEHLLQIYDLVYMDETSLYKSVADFTKTQTAITEIKTDLDNITHILDESIYGHSHAKSQILKIVGQWMTGEQSGYCFGFEGSPGVGKTSLAKKGLANCLKNGAQSRPFAFIALGGSCNGSTLEGHSYTYVNSTWGRIADILMDTNCMNPIIYVDELDKVSKTEHGKEIIGILMHMIDTTQNSGFQDKYFSGIELDLSKALFIFSYNDPSQIDKILLDRIHRIRFENLSFEEKIVIVRKYILPEINRKMGFSEDTIVLTDEIVEYIIETYTLESGVRKLKEVIFDLFGEINIELLQSAPDIQIPFILTRDHMNTRYLLKYTKVRGAVIHTTPEIGVLNGLWASVYGNGGIIPIQTMFYPSTSFLELKLTGLQGDVMKESMNVAKSLAWNLLDADTRKRWIREFEETKCQGLHIHCPEGAVSKDGPSAGTAITLAIFSLFTKRPIRNDVAITGETNLQGFVTEIGGLEDKIRGGIKAGITTFLFPKANIPDFEKYMKKYDNQQKNSAIRFFPVSHISETFEHVFTDLSITTP
jgi:ATP-dependent Lon protease